MNQKTPETLYEERLANGELRADPVQALAVDALTRVHADTIEFVEAKRGWFSKGPELPLGLYMYGGVGRGKSMLMDLFCDTLPENIKWRRVHFHEFMISVHDFMHEARSSGKDVEKALPNFAKKVKQENDVLCFDEFHVTDIADAMILGRFFTMLFDHGVVIISTSNWDPHSLYEGGLQRDRFLPFIDLLVEKMQVLFLDSPVDYRGEFIAEEGSYFTPLTGETKKKLDALFKHITFGAKSQQDHFNVKGRRIDVDAACAGAARFSFSQLCERPRGAEDFIAIAERYETVFLEGIPKLGYDRRNEAKRLMILIDALYEAGTRLVVSAATTPDRLYTGADHAYEFDRTISRLNEMQSKDYIEKEK